MKNLFAATPDDFRRAFLGEEFDIIHFSGHSDGSVLMFENERGESLGITLQALGQYVAGSSAVRCVISNACESLAGLTFPIAEYRSA